MIKKLLKLDKRAKALIFMAAIASLSIVLGLYLILVQETTNKARWSAGIGSIYLMQSGKQGFSGAAAQKYTKQAYDAHLKAVRLAPYESSLWVKFAYVLAIKYEDKAQALRALDIAEALNPQNRDNIARYRIRVEGVSDE